MFLAKFSELGTRQW